MYQQSQPLGMNSMAHNNSAENAGKIMQILNMFKKQPLTGQQQQAFQQGAGPVSPAGAQNYLNGSFNNQIWDGYHGFQGMPSIYDRLMKGGY